ncbi:MAG TPA: phosphoglycerate dehydrogenase [Gemmatimonadaceae bacterium]|jgi:D-3-phosphoglycerate dehydrogenase / 2-oxoglutarate reductase|nr:phosphoglycerate dehydrogenase [Gemmatimonadaceae bacterium]
MATLRVLVTDEVDPRGVEILRAEPSLLVDERPTRPARELVDEIGQYDAFVGRSATQLPADLLRAAKRLRVIGRAGVGTDNIDLAEATALGIAVINAPSGNTIAVAELFFGALLSFVRHLPRAFNSMRGGRWDRSDLLGSEINGRTLGIVGLGRIGGEVSRRARAFGMEVVAYDPYIQRERFEALAVERVESLDALLPRAQVLTVHTPLTDETRGMIGADALSKLPTGAIVANFARGGIVDDAALADALTSGHLDGALLDVYAREPLAADHPFRSMDNVLLTPHLGASTAEGQRNVAVDVCIAVRNALVTGELSGAVNLAAVDRGRWRELQGALSLARQSAAIARAMLADRGAAAVEQLTVAFGREFAGADTLIAAAAAEGLLAAIMGGDRINLVNARARATERGIALATVPALEGEDATMIRATVRSNGSQMTVGGVALPGVAPRLTRIGDFKVDVAPRRTLIVLTNADVPGVIGRVGTVLGDAGVNIAEYHQARLSQGGEALAAISVDGVVTEDVRRRLLGIRDVRSATVIHATGTASTPGADS